MARTAAGPPGLAPDGDPDGGSRPEPPARPWPGQLGGLAARPQLIRALNEQLLLSHIRQLGPCSPADLARISGLSKPTVSLALGNVERSGLVRAAGQRTGVPGRPATLYEIRPEAGFVLGLDVGHQYLRGALADMTGEIRTKLSARTRATSVRGLLAELVRLADTLSAEAGLNQVRYHPDGDRQPGRVRPAARRDRADGRAGGLEPPGRAGRAAGRIRSRGRPGERRGRRGAGRAGPRVRQGIRQLRLCLDRDRHRHGPGARRQAASRRARGGGRDCLYADLGRAGSRPGGRPQAGSARGIGLGGGRGAGGPAGRAARAGLGAPGLRRGRGGRCRARPRWWPERRAWWPRRSARW